MRTKHSELGIGIGVTAATLIVVLGILALGTSDLFVSGMRIVMTVPDADGLAAGDSVLFRGIAVGTVDSLTIDRKGVVVEMKLKGNPDIPSDSRFVIKSSSLLGDKVVEIRPGVSTKKLRANAGVLGSSENGLLGLASSAGQVQQQVSTILSNIDNLSGATTLKSVYGTINNLNETIATLQGILADNRLALKTTMDNLSAISGENRQPVRRTIQTLDATISSIDRTSIELQSAIRQTSSSLAALNSVLSQVEAGKGTLGKLVKDDSLYMEMKQAVSQFRALVEDIKKNPQKYVTVKLF